MHSRYNLISEKSYPRSWSEKNVHCTASTKVLMTLVGATWPIWSICLWIWPAEPSKFSLTQTNGQLHNICWYWSTTSCNNSGDTSPSWNVINLPIISHTAASLPPPPPPLPINAASKTKKCWKLKQSTLKGGGGSGKGLHSRYGGYWKLEKVFF